MWQRLFVQLSVLKVMEYKLLRRSFHSFTPVFTTSLKSRLFYAGRDTDWFRQRNGSLCPLIYFIF